MRQNLVYDVPTRVFHWLFASLFLTAILIGKILDHDSPNFPYHMLAGLTLNLLVMTRLVWGVVGTKHARFSSFALKPKDLISYFKGILSGEKKLWAGHNPASSWAGLLMILFAMGLGISGYLMASGPENELLEEVHEILANGFIVIAILHVSGIVLHTLRHKDLIGLSMLDGKKAQVAASETIPSAKPAVGLVMFVLVVAFAGYLLNGFDKPSRQLNFFGSVLQLGESENESEGGSGEHSHDHDHDDENDDHDD